MSKVLYTVPIFNWGKGPTPSPVIPLTRNRHSWNTNLDGLTLWHFSKRAAPPSPIPLGGPGVRAGWSTNLNNYTLWQWNAHHIPRHAEVVGEVIALFHPLAAQSATLIGEVVADFGSLTGALLVEGSGTCTGSVLAVFNTTIPNSGTTTGQVIAQFYSHGGQAIGCIAAGENLDATIPPPRNAVH